MWSLMCLIHLNICMCAAYPEIFIYIHTRQCYCTVCTSFHRDWPVNQVSWYCVWCTVDSCIPLLELAWTTWFCHRTRTSAKHTRLLASCQWVRMARSGGLANKTLRLWWSIWTMSYVPSAPFVCFLDTCEKCVLSFLAFCVWNIPVWAWVFVCSAAWNRPTLFPDLGSVAAWLALLDEYCHFLDLKKCWVISLTMRADAEAQVSVLLK